MRNLPSSLSAVCARADQLAAKSRSARAKAAGTAAPKDTISPAKVKDGVATLRLYDYIDMDGGYWGISADEVAEALDAIEVPFTRIELRINSGGGHVWDALAILNTLRDRDEPVTAIVDGIAASAASFIAVACDEVVMMPNSRLMIHDAIGLCVGQAVDMREYADFLDDTSQNIAEILAEKAGGTVEEWRARMIENRLIGTWYSAQDAVDIGLADSVGRTDDSATEDKATPPALVWTDAGLRIHAPAPAPADRQTDQPTEPSAETDAVETGADRLADRQQRLQAKRHELNAQKAAV